MGALRKRVFETALVNYWKCQVIFRHERKYLILVPEMAHSCALCLLLGKKAGVELSEKGRLVLEDFGCTTYRCLESVPNNYFDITVMSSVLEHYSDPLGALKKVKKMLRRSGKLWLLVPNSQVVPLRVV